MSDLLKYKQVNWIDGMKINKDHFISLENHFVARSIDWNNQLLNHNIYGLLPHRANKEKFLSVKTIIDNQNYLNVKVESCHAITQGGYRIEISGEEQSNSEFTLKDVKTDYDLGTAKDGELYLVISVDPYTRIPDGTPIPEEIPLRSPFICPAYKLQLIPVEQFGGELNSNMLIIGKLRVSNNTAELIQEYIPPCYSVDSHSKLLEFTDYIESNISSLEQSSVKIIYDINEKHATNILTQIVTFISENLLSFISNNMTRFRWSAKSLPPVYVIEFVVTLARVLKNSFDTRTAEEKEILLNYFSEHFDIVPNRFKQLMDHTIALDYEHNEIYNTIKKVEDFMNVISLLFKELSKMELIDGKKKQETRKIDIILR